MPLDVQSGELADRLRRFFRLTGRIPAQIDEVTVPVANVQNLDVAPYRSRVHAGGNHVVGAAVALANTVAGIRVPAPRAAGSTGVFVVQKIIVRNANAGVQDYLIGLTDDATPINQVAGAFLLDLDQTPDQGAVSGVSRIGVQVLSGTITPLAIQEITRVTVPGQTILQLDHLSIALRSGFGPNGAVSALLVVGADTVNLTVDATFLGLWHPDAL